MAVGVRSLHGQVQAMLARGFPDIGQVHYVVDSDFRTIAQGWSRADRTGPLDLYSQRNPGYVFRTGDYGRDQLAMQAAIDATIDNRGDIVHFTPGSYSIGTTALAVNSRGIRLLGPPVAHPRRSLVTITDAIGSGLTVSVSDVELGFFTAVPLTATAFLSVSNGANFGLIHDVFYNAAGVAADTATEFCNAAATTTDWLVKDSVFKVDAAQGDAFTLASGTRWTIEYSDFLVALTTVAWASVITLSGTPLGNIVRNCTFRGEGGATPAVFTNIFTGVANVNGQLQVQDCRIDGTALATATAIETGFGTTTDIELAENYQTGDATTEGGVLITLA